MTGYGQLIQDREHARLEFRRHLDRSPERVWPALTEEQQLAAWFPTTIDGERSGGAILTFRFEHVEINPMQGEMLAFELDVLGKATRDGAGWHQCLDALANSLAGDPSRPDDPDRRHKLRDGYAGRFGPDASTLGPPQEWENSHTS